ncbi:hypothetical protein LVJ94_34525 [Pendulispora rubella]|uniref:Uncharacterized protein n=1 Tax=Pendulispora rubella TaxID=2741070 RepID=A0ABZ2KTY8_9BACT
MPALLRELDEALGNAQPEATAIGALLAKHASFFAFALGLSTADILGYQQVPDEQIAQRLATRLQRALLFARINEFAVPRGTPTAIRALLHVLRHGEIGGSNVGEFVAKRADALAPLLKMAPDILRRYTGECDDYVARSLWPSARRAAWRAERDKGARDAVLAQSAVETFGRGVRWHGERAYFEPTRISALLRSPSKFVRFYDQRCIDIVISRDALKGVLQVWRELYRDLVLYADPEGLHARWKEGRGGFNARSKRKEARRARGATSLLPVLLSHSSYFPRGQWLGRTAAQNVQ